MNAGPTVPPTSPESDHTPARFNWLLLLACLLTPALLTCLTVLIDKSSNSPAPGVAIIGGALGGIGAGVVLGRRLGRSTGLKILFGLIFAAVGGVASITIATVGCLATGYQLNFH